MRKPPQIKETYRLLIDVAYFDDRFAPASLQFAAKIRYDVAAPSNHTIEWEIVDPSGAAHPVPDEWVIRTVLEKSGMYNIRATARTPEGSVVSVAALDFGVNGAHYAPLRCETGGVGVLDAVPCTMLRTNVASLPRSFRAVLAPHSPVDPMVGGGPAPVSDTTIGWLVVRDGAGKELARAREFTTPWGTWWYASDPSIWSAELGEWTVAWEPVDGVLEEGTYLLMLEYPLSGDEYLIGYYPGPVG